MITKFKQFVNENYKIFEFNEITKDDIITIDKLAEMILRPLKGNMTPEVEQQMLKYNIEKLNQILNEGDPTYGKGNSGVIKFFNKQLRNTVAIKSWGPGTFILNPKEVDFIKNKEYAY